MSKSKLIKRLSWYYPMEKLHAFVTFPALLIYVLYSYSLKESIFLVYGLLICICILYQGQHYWKLKLKKLKGESFDNDKNIRFFQFFKKINLILMGLIPFVFIVQMEYYDWNFANNKLLYWGLAANIFGILEHINYYHTQLMVDNLADVNYILRNKKLKQASLAKDLLNGKF
ncbi:MAG: hypothetical protein WCY77_01570 [Weeksellaceae bacterium]